jgi:hypothetical protein
VDFDIKEARKYAYESRREIDKGIVSFWYPEYQSRLSKSKLEVFPDGYSSMEKVAKEHLGLDRVARMSDEYKEYIGLKTYK